MPSLGAPATVAYTPSGTASYASTYTATLTTPLVVGKRSSLSLALPAGTVTPAAADAEGGLVIATVWPMTNAEIQYGDHDGFGQYQPYGWLSSENPTIGLTVKPLAKGNVSLEFSKAAGLSATYKRVRVDQLKAGSGG